MALTRVLVTGGTGFVGSEVVRKLVNTNEYHVTVLDINPPALGTKSYPQVAYIRASVLNLEELCKVIKEARPAIIVHTVGFSPTGSARYSMKAQKALFEVNVTGTRNVIEAAKECGVKGFVHTSSITVLTDELDEDFSNADETWPVGRATTLYGQTKTAAEEIVLSANTSDFRTCALRLAPVFGPHDPSIVPIMHSLIARGETPFILGDGTNLTDFVYVSNVADAHVLAVKNLQGDGSASGEAFFITNGQPIAFRDMCLAVWKEFEHVPKWQVKIPKNLGWGFGLFIECITWVLRSEATLSRGAMQDACGIKYVSIKKARSVLGYEPAVSLPEAIQITCQAYKQRLNI